MTHKSYFSVCIKNLRLAKGWSLKKAAEQIGVPVSTYRDWEYGNAVRGEPHGKVAQVFGVPLDELFGKDPTSEKSELLRAVQEAKEKIDRVFEIARTL